MGSHIGWVGVSIFSSCDHPPFSLVQPTVSGRPESVPLLGQELCLKRVKAHEILGRDLDFICLKTANTSGKAVI